MDVEPPSLRRSARQKSAKVIRFEASPRAPIKRTKKVAENTSPAVTVNGSSEMGDHSEDDGSPKKKSRRNSTRRIDGSGDHADMDTDELREEEMNIKPDSSQTTNDLSIPQGEPKLLSSFVMGDRYQMGISEKKDTDWSAQKSVRSSEKANATVTKSKVATRSQKVQDTSAYKVTSMAEYKKEMDIRAKSAAVGVTQPLSRADLSRTKHHIHGTFPERGYTVKQRVQNISPQKEALQFEKQGKKKPAATTQGAGDSSKGFLWYFCRLALLALLGTAVVFACKAFPLQRTKWNASSFSNQIYLEQFSNLLSRLKAQFVSQRTDLWMRSKIHLEKHLKDVQPNEPVSLIFTAGVKAEKTLHCLAKGFASTFSSALNGSVLHINGSSKAGQQSDVVKLDIDRQLQEAFDGDTFAAVIHNLEELPPGSTIIFYRYCDHENAAYKRVFLLFTVLLPQDEVSGELMYVEELVQDYLKERLVGASSQTSFDEMDNDKFGGLWSRISHLILPVVPETDVEKKGC
ncbi:torsin-1A-interacting protein 1-like isoform 1-T1 [Synchiropus picturatus]